MKNGNKEGQPIKDHVTMPFSENQSVTMPTKECPTAFRILMVITSSIFAAELFIMFLLSFFPPFSLWIETFFDASLLIILILPILYLFLFRPLIIKSQQAEERTYELAKINEQLEREREKLDQAEEEINSLARFPSENPNPVFRVAKDGTILYANNASEPLLDIWGCQRGQILPYYWRNLILDVLRSGLSIESEVECKNYIYSLTLSPTVDANYVNIYGLNITERKHGETLIIRQRAVSDAVNQIFKKVLTSKTEEELGQTCLSVCEELTGSKFGFIGELNPAGLFDTLAISNPGWDACTMSGTEKVKAIKNMEIRGVDRSTMREGKSRIVNDLVSHPDRVGTPKGHPVVTSFLGVPLEEAGKIIGMIGLGNKQSGYDAADQEDIEKLSVAIVESLRRKRMEIKARESEEKYRSLFEESRDAIYISIREGKIVDINQSAVDLLGYRREEIGGIAGGKLFAHPSDRDRFVQEIEQKRSVKEYEVKFRKKDGTQIHCLLTSTVRQASDGSILGYQGIIRDITEKRKMEGELLKTSKMESIGVLAGGIAHDFNNILTGLLGNISLAKMDVNAKDGILKRLIEAEKAILRAKDLTHQLLTFSKGGAPIRKTISIAELIKDSVSFALRGSNAQFEFSIPDNLWSVEVDEGQMNQVINNLIINANQAMPEGGIIKVRAENIAVDVENAFPLKEGKHVKITLEDQGHGIPEKHLPKIFDPYFTTKQKGSGLGLSTTYSIIKRHNGYITAESRFGVGTIFYIYLPASEKELLIKEDMEERVFVGGGKILVMDDEEIVRNVAGMMLSNNGYEVKFANDGIEAIELYKQAKETGHPFDAAIMDLTVPGGMGGKEAIKKMLELDPEIKAIASSGYSNDPIMSNFRQTGFSAVLPKPYRVQELIKTLQEIIMGRK